MARRLGTLVFLATLATLLASSSRAFAAILPACELEIATVHVLPPAEPACEVVTAVDDQTGETSVAPICDARGASAIAPPRIHPVSDATLSASSSCSKDAVEIGVAPNRNDGPSSAADGAAAHPAIPATPPDLPSPTPLEESFAHGTDRGSALSGHPQGVERPPR